jgi:succinate-semialdehyde dehydrogenase / glutarate-semialdehyde dehydrogenase
MFQVLNLKDKSLLCDKAYINGQWVTAQTGKTFGVFNPANQSQLSTVPAMGAQETRQAIEAAAQAFPLWRQKTAKERGKILRKFAELMLENVDDLATIMTAEQGKPMAEARGEVAYAASFYEWFAEEGRRLYGDVIPAGVADKRYFALRQPVGVVGAITPWNFPAAMITRKAGAALAAGCTFVVKPAESTPLSALAQAVLAERAGIPAGVFNVVTGDPIAIGGELTQHPTVAKISFTGSTEVGRILMAQCAPTIKKLSLELGGNAPFIVFNDADIEQAVAGAMISKYRNAGQTCVCANRFLVQAKVYDAFVTQLVAATKKLRVGDGLQGPTEQGPLIDQQAIDKVEEHIKDALDQGARLELGGKRHSLGGTFFEPTILSHVTAKMKVAREETFGPVAPIFKFETDDEAIAMANATEFGLAAYFYTRDIARSWRVAEALEYGIVGLNTGLISTEEAPFGGWKQSGLGREGSRYGLLDYTELKYLCMGGLMP